MGVDGKGGKMVAKVDKQAAKATSKTEKQHLTKEARAAHKLTICQEQNCQHQQKNCDAMEEDYDLTADEQKETAKKETCDKQAMTHAQLLKEKEKQKRVDAMQAALVNTKIQ
jgi:hypothetical protein